MSAEVAPDESVEPELVEALKGLLLCARWQLREGPEHHPRLRAAVQAAVMALAKLEGGE